MLPFSALLADAPRKLSRYHRPPLGTQLTNQLHNFGILLHVTIVFEGSEARRSTHRVFDEHC